MKYRQAGVCQSCRVRKLGCDGKRPTCSQCLLRRRQCPGYAVEWIFVHSKSPATANNLGQGTSVRPVSPSRTLSWPLQDVVSLCAQNFIPAEELAVSCTQKTTTPRICGAWIEILPSLLANSPSDGFLPAAVKALAVSIVARGPNGLAPVADALKSQCLAMQALRIALRHDHPSTFEFKAASMMCLFLSQILLPTSDISSSVHAEGISNFIQRQRPTYYSSGYPHRLFVGFRPMLILHSFLARKSSMLAQVPWRDEPFSQEPIAPLQALFSDACLLPIIFEKLDQEKLSVATISVTKPALEQLLAALNILNTRYDQFKASRSRNLWYCSPDDQGTLIFPDITIANFLTHYWAFWIICFTHIRQLCAATPELNQNVLYMDGFVLEAETIPEQLLEFSLLILRSMDYLMQGHMGLYGVASAALPFQTAYAYLLHNKPDKGGQNSGIAEKVFNTVLSKGYQDILGSGLVEFRYPQVAFS